MAMEVSVNGKRKAETDPATTEARNVRSKTSTPSLPADLRDSLQYKFKVLANIPTGLPFFSETAQDIIDLYAAKASPSEDAIPALIQCLKDEGADEEKVVAARSLWESNVEIHTLRQIGARCLTLEAVKKAIQALLIGAKEVPALKTDIVALTQLNATVRALLNADSLDGKFQSTQIKPSNTEQPAGEDAKVASKISGQQAIIQNDGNLKESINGTGQHVQGAGAHLQGPPNHNASENIIDKEKVPKQFRTAPTNGAQMPRLAPGASQTKPSGSAAQDTIGKIDPESLDQLVAEASSNSMKTPNKQQTDTLSLLEATLNSGKQNQPAKATTAQKPSEPTTSSGSQMTAKPVTALKTTVNGSIGGTMPPTPVSAVSLKVTPQSAPSIKGQIGRRQSGEGPLIKKENDISPIRRASDSWPQPIDTYRPRNIARTATTPSPLDTPLADRITKQNAPTLAPHQMTCYFWFVQGHCNRGGYCNYKHEMLDYVAQYVPGKHHSFPLRIIHKPTIEQTRDATFAHVRPKMSKGIIESNNGMGDIWPPWKPEELSRTESRSKSEAPSRHEPSNTPIVDALWGMESITLGLRDSAISTILKNIRERRPVSARDFVTDLYDSKGKMSNFDLNTNSGIYSKLMGVFNLPHDKLNVHQVRNRMEDFLRPFVVANKSKFLDLPAHAFLSNKGDKSEGDHLKSLEEPMHRNWSKRFAGSPPAK